MSANIFTYRDGRIRFDVEHGGAVRAFFPSWGFSDPDDHVQRPSDALRHARSSLVRHAGKANADEIAPVLEALEKAIEYALQGSLF
jgi:hypothetical protein